MLRQRWIEGKHADTAPQQQFSAVRDARYNQVAAMVTCIVNELKQQPCLNSTTAHNFWEEFVLQWRTGPYVGVAEYSNQVYQACLQLVRSLSAPEQQELWQHFGFSLDPKPEDCPSQEIWAAFSITADLTATFYHLVCDAAEEEYRAGGTGKRENKLTYKSLKGLYVFLSPKRRPLLIFLHYN